MYSSVPLTYEDAMILKLIKLKRFTRYLETPLTEKEELLVRISNLPIEEHKRFTFAQRTKLWTLDLQR